MSSFFNHLGRALGCVRPQAVGAPEQTGSREKKNKAAAAAAAADANSDADKDAIETSRPASPASSRSSKGPAAGADLASGLRYGVEVEHQGLTFKQVGKIVGDTIAGAKVYQDTIVSPDGRNWRLDPDAGGVELVSPILEGRDDLALLQQIVAALGKAGGKADERAGLHVHIDAARFSGKELQSLVALMTRHEHWLYPVWGVHERRRTQWCRAIDKDNVAQALRPEGEGSRRHLTWFYGGSRYYGLNLQNVLGPSDKRTIEFRYLNGTLDPCAIGCAVGFYMAIAERALQMADANHPFDATPSTLPSLIKELGIERAHPVAAHLYGLLRERIEAGWDAEAHGSRPNLDKVLNDDAFVAHLCRHMTPRDSPRELADLLHLLTKNTPETVARIARDAEKLAKDLSWLRGTEPGSGVLMRLAGQYRVTAEALAPFLRDLGGWWHDDILNQALEILGAHMHRRSHLSNAVRVAKRLEDRSAEDRVPAMKRFLAWNEGDLQELAKVMMALPERVSQRLGYGFVYYIEDGEGDGGDIAALGAKLLAFDSARLMRNPHECFKLASEMLRNERYEEAAASTPSPRSSSAMSEAFSLSGQSTPLMSPRSLNSHPVTLTRSDSEVSSPRGAFAVSEGFYDSDTSECAPVPAARRATDRAERGSYPSSVFAAQAAAVRPLEVD